MEKENYLLPVIVGNPERARSRHLARSGSQSQPRIFFISPAHGANRVTSFFEEVCLFVSLPKYLTRSINWLTIDEDFGCIRVYKRTMARVVPYFRPIFFFFVFFFCSSWSSPLKIILKKLFSSGSVNIGKCLPRLRLGKYSPMFISPSANNC